MWNWLIIAHCISPKEKSQFQHHINIFASKVNHNVEIYYCINGKTSASKVELYHINGATKNLNIVLTVDKTTSNSRPRYHCLHMAQITTYLKRNNIPIQGIICYGHGGGVMLGGWAKYNFMTIIDFNKYILEPLKPVTVLFDSCYIGVSSAVYEVVAHVPEVKCILASPAYHPSMSVFDTNSIYTITGTDTINSLRKKLSGITCEFQSKRWPKYKCFVMYDTTYVATFVDKLAAAVDKSVETGKPIFKFDKNSLISKYDNVTHDLYRALQDPKLKEMCAYTAKNICNVESCKVSRGMSIERIFPDSHVEHFKQLAWYQKLKRVYIP
jgi:hypothetical protein